MLDTRRGEVTTANGVNRASSLKRAREQKDRAAPQVAQVGTTVPLRRLRRYARMLRLPALNAVEETNAPLLHSMRQVAIRTEIKVCEWLHEKLRCEDGKNEWEKPPAFPANTNYVPQGCQQGDMHDESRAGREEEASETEKTNKERGIETGVEGKALAGHGIAYSTM